MKPSLCLILGAASLLALPLRAQEGFAATLVLSPAAAPRVRYGADRLAEAVRAAGGSVTAGPGAGSRRIVVGRWDEPALKRLLPPEASQPGPEGFLLASGADGSLVVAGADDSGELYGCLELADRVRSARGLPAQVRDAETPAFRLRGACIGLQKPTLLPGYAEYDYPLTPELFPSFYDRSYWQGYLDFLAQVRMNTLYLWNGHPFASLVRVPDYPDALEVSPRQLEQNAAAYRDLISEADRRGIKIVQMFYNIELSKPFAERHGLPPSLEAPVPIAADYTRKTLAEFVRQYPTVGLLVCLGEALRGTRNQVDWLTQVILPGIKEGARAAGLAEPPLVILRTHALDARAVVPAGLKIYPRMDTMEKYNGESLTTSEPRGEARDLHLEMSRLADTHLANVHILANLEPFRYGDERFIKACAQAAHDRLGARGLHLYPLSYWDWPVTPDVTDDPLLEYQRDWIWYEAWGRYTWNPGTSEASDHAHWIARLSRAYGAEAAENILRAYDDSGECAPRIARRFGITEGNRQTLSLGMTLDELVHPEKYHAFAGLWEWQAPPGERIPQYVERDWKQQPHYGETPIVVIRDILRYSERAVSEIDAAGPQVSDNAEEFGRLQNDIHCIREMSLNYAAKAQAAILVLRYNYSHNPQDLVEAYRQLSISLDHYRALAGLASGAYRYANGLQTGQRRIPLPGAVQGRPAYFRWDQLVPVYEKELADFRDRLASMGVAPDP